MADKVEILLRARGGRQVAAEAGMASRSFTRMERASTLANRAGGKLGGVMRGLGRGALYAGGAIAGGLIVEVKRGRDAWEEHRKVAADTEQAIRSTGGVANVSAKHVDKLAQSIEAKTAADDDAVAAGQNMLLTFTRVRNEQGKGNKVFDRATGLAVDMSKRFGTDTKTAFVQLGKALDDPIKGITALRRSGVSFTDAERDKIKTLEETGHHLEAQRMILAALDKQVGGSARAQATPLDKLNRAWGDLEKELGRAVAPTLDKVARKLTHLTDDATAIMGRHDLTWDAKVKLFSRQDLEPEARKIVQGLKDAHLDDKLGHAIEWAIPKMANAFLTAGPAAVKSLVKGFNDAGPGGKLLIAWFTGKKLGLGKLALGGLLGGKGGIFGKGNTPANPLWVQQVGAPGTGGKLPNWVKTAGKGAGVTGIVRGALKFGGKAAPWAVVAEALINADTAGLTPGRERGLLAEAAGRKTGTGRLAGFPDSHGRAPSAPQRVKFDFIGGGKIANQIGHSVSGAVRPLPSRTAVAFSRSLTSNVTRPLTSLPNKTSRGIRDATKDLPTRTGRSVRDGTRHLERLPERVAGAVARRPLDVNVVSEITVPIDIDGERVANVIARRNSKNRDRR